MAAGEQKPSIPDRRPAAVGRTTAETAVAAPVVVVKARQRPKKDIAPISTAVGLVDCLLVMWVGGMPRVSVCCNANASGLFDAISVVDGGPAIYISGVRSGVRAKRY